MQCIKKLFILFITCTIPTWAVAIDPIIKWVVTGTRLPTALRGPLSVYDGSSDFIYVVCGRNETHHNDQVFKYRISTGQIQVDGQFIQSYMGPAQLVGQDIFVLGGQIDDQYVPDIYRYSTNTSTYNLVNNLPFGVFKMASAWDPAQQAIFTFGGTDYQVENIDHIFKYDPSTNEIQQVGSLPDTRYDAISTFANDKIYVFGGHGESPTAEWDIFEFDPTTGNATKYPIQLTGNTAHAQGCSVFVNEKIYIIGRYNFMTFDPANGNAENVTVDESSWPVSLWGESCVYVEKLHRIYVMGGFGRFNGESEERHFNEIAYIDLDLEDMTPLPTTTETVTTTTLNPIFFTCFNRSNGFYPHPSDCAMFIGCQNEETYYYSCPSPLQYHPVDKVCDYPDVVQCETSCAERPDGRYPHPHDCSLYIICRSEEPTLVKCPPPLLFDREDLSCSFPEDVTCRVF